MNQPVDNPAFFTNILPALLGLSYRSHQLGYSAEYVTFVIFMVIYAILLLSQPILGAALRMHRLSPAFYLTGLAFSLLHGLELMFLIPTMTALDPAWVLFALTWLLPLITTLASTALMWHITALIYHLDIDRHQPKQQYTFMFQGTFTFCQLVARIVGSAPVYFRKALPAVWIIHFVLFAIDAVALAGRMYFVDIIRAETDFRPDIALRAGSVLLLFFALLSCTDAVAIGDYSRLIIEGNYTALGLWHVICSAVLAVIWILITYFLYLSSPASAFQPKPFDWKRAFFGTLRDSSVADGNPDVPQVGDIPDIPDVPDVPDVPDPTDNEFNPTSDPLISSRNR